MGELSAEVEVIWALLSLPVDDDEASWSDVDPACSDLIGGLVGEVVIGKVIVVDDVVGLFEEISPEVGGVVPPVGI